VKRPSIPEIIVSRRSLLVHGASTLLLGTAGCSKGPSSCNDVSTLNADQKTARDSLGYEDTTPQPGKTCVKCAQYVPAEKVSDCGHCKVLAGPVHPNGYCRAYTPKS
jgi:hypothetical protein